MRLPLLSSSIGNALLNLWRIHGLLGREREQVKSQNRTGSWPQGKDLYGLDNASGSLASVEAPAVGDLNNQSPGGFGKSQAGTEGARTGGGCFPSELGPSSWSQGWGSWCCKRCQDSALRHLLSILSTRHGKYIQILSHGQHPNDVGC